MNTTKKYSPEGWERAVRLVVEQEAEHGSQWAAIRSIAEKIGRTREPRRWVCQAERDEGAGRGSALGSASGCGSSRVDCEAGWPSARPGGGLP